MKNLTKIALTLGLFLSYSFAQDTNDNTSLESREKALIAALDSIEENVLGFALNGRAKSGVVGSILNSKDLQNGEYMSEYSAFSNMLLSISVRPSNETKATFDLWFHKDWQSAYREGNNTPIVRWWSYDGSILDKKLKFNLGTMRVAYTPLTIYLPEPDIIMEPEVFSNLKKDAMEDRYLDGTNRRLLQGLNVEYSQSAGIFDNIFLQGTVARLRKVADETDRIFFDFDPNKDRFATAARIGVETFGFTFAISDVYAFNRFSSSLKNTQNPSLDTIVDYEKNNVLSFELNYSSKKLLSGPVSFGVGAEYALSNWSHWQDKKVPNDPETVLALGTIDSTTIPSIDAPNGNSNIYPYYRTEVSSKKPYKYETSRIEGLKNKGAFLGNAFVSLNQNSFEAKISGRFLNVNKDFEAELAASPAYLPNSSILNSDATLEYNLEQFRTGSLENMYYSLYYTLPLNATTIISGTQGNVANFACIKNNSPSYSPNPATNPISLYQVACLDNNYAFGQYYRNAYTQQTYTRLERNDENFISRLDPSVNLALPYGYATPDRTGGDADLNFTWNKAVSVRGVLGIYSSENGDYTRFGGGTEVNVARLAGLGNALVVSASYEKNKEEKGAYNPQTDRIIAGTKIGIWRGISFVGGFQQLAKEFKNPYVLYENSDNRLAVSKTSEILVIGGPQIKISEKANFILQGGLLTNTIDFILNDEKYDIDINKYIVSGTVNVGF